MEPSVPLSRPTWQRILRRVIMLGLLATMIGYVGLCILVAHVLTRTNNRPSGIHPQEISQNAVAWSGRTADGLTLRGWYCPTAEHRRLIVLVHGMGGSLDEMAEIGHDLHARGFDILLFDLRGHGASDPSRLTMGASEREDVRTVVDWAKSQGYNDDRVGWLGHSMGASTLLMEAEHNDRIRVLVVDSAYGNLPELLDRQLTEHSHLPRVFNPGILFSARYLFGVRTDNLIPVRSARNWGKRPLMVIHGQADSVVPFEQANQIASAAGTTCQTMIVPEVDHVGAYHDDPDHYIDRVSGFFDEHLAP